MSGINFIALERNPGQVDVLRRFGTKVYFGDPTRPDVLRAAGVEQAKLIIIAMDDPPGVLRCVDMVKHNFPDVAILARARNRWYSHLLMDRAVEGFVRETFYSSLEMSRRTLVGLGLSQAQADARINRFKNHDLQVLAAQHAVYDDAAKVMQTAQEARAELARLFEMDRLEEESDKV